MQFTNLNNDWIHVGYRWLSTDGRIQQGYGVWCYGPTLPPYIKETDVYVEKLYTHVELSPDVES